MILLDAAVTPSSQALVVGINADILFSIIAFLCITLGSWMVLALRDHKAKTEAALKEKVDVSEFNRAVALILDSNKEQMKGRERFFEWDRKVRQRSEFPGPKDDL
jgi:hypothetical protein